MTIEEFANNVEILSKYNGNVKDYILCNIGSVSVNINLNDCLIGNITSSGIEAYNNHRKDSIAIGDEVTMQIWEMLKIFDGKDSLLPLVNCKLKR